MAKLTPKEVADSYKLTEDDRGLAEEVLEEVLRREREPSDRDTAGGPPTEKESLPSPEDVIAHHATSKDRLRGIERYFIALWAETR